ncbi:protein of unknown function [Sporobacter termitidis DSM 10068]|uniref:DNA repair photolyase n=1 Tax=Sporobacter termitidis DSM 10068 TaxID=1123282 RepID=A0A1M5ZH39_9FIRM|nr:DUF1848 domain-containing protein [Sporobacter termitidis]SHI23540.1 protein of unknown function [Sporobacter termitidis DSM 10068]
MIISASRRTDIPNYFSDWFFKRLEEEYVLVRNPMNPRQVSRVGLSTDEADGFVFWTKNPLPMLDKLERLGGRAYYFQFTLTAYGADAEPNVPSKNDVVIPAFRRLADAVGPDRVVWRYDPIFLSDKYSIDYHAEFFEKLAGRLEGYTTKCTVSFLDNYRHIERWMKSVGAAAPTDAHKDELARRLADSARRHGLTLDACAESIDLSRYGIGRARCVDAAVFEKILGCRLDIPKDKNQRPACGCAGSVDIGAYSTCLNGCAYCYANHAQGTVLKSREKYDPASPLLCGRLGEDDRVTARRAKTNMIHQLRLSEDV